jgi:hypothetical protein
MQDFRVRAFRIAATATMLFAVVLPAAAQLGTAPGKFVDVEGGKIYYEQIVSHFLEVNRF